MRHIVLERPGPVALTMQRPAPASLTLERPAPVSLILQLAGDRPNTGGGDTARIVRTLSSPTRSLIASQALAGAISRTLPVRVVSLSGGQYVTALIGRTVAAAQRSVSASQHLTGAISRAVQPATRTLIADNTGSAFIMRSVPPAVRSLVAGQYLTAAVSRTAPVATRGLSASQTISGTVSRTINPATRSVAAGQYLSAAVIRTANAASRTLSGTQTLSGLIARSTPAASRSVVASQILTGAITRTASSATRSLAGLQPSAATITRTANSVTRALTAGQTLTGTVSRSVPAATRILSASATLWTPANLTTAPLVIMDAATLTWSGSNFSSGTNTGSLGGTFATALGTPTKAAADINGYDAIAFSTSGIKLASATTPAGNKTLFYVSKRLGTPSLGAILTQSSTTPGYSFFDEINVSTTPTGGVPVAPGDVGAIGWPSGTTVVNKTVVAHPTTDDGTYHMNVGKIGTAHLWRYDGTALTPTGSTENSIASITADLTIGTSAVSQNFNGRIAYVALLQDPTTTEIEKLEGWAAWKYGLTSKLPSGHPYKSSQPLV